MRYIWYANDSNGSLYHSGNAVAWPNRYVED